MGMYTELNISIEFKKETPQYVIDAMDIMADKNEIVRHLPNAIIHEPLFRTDRWRWMLHSDSYYFSGSQSLIWKFDKIADAWFLTVRSNLKNYCNEIELFLKFIAPWIAESEYFIGYMRYEVFEHPTLLYARNGAIITRQVAEYEGVLI